VLQAGERAFGDGKPGSDGHHIDPLVETASGARPSSMHLEVLTRWVADYSKLGMGSLAALIADSLCALWQACVCD